MPESMVENLLELAIVNILSQPLAAPARFVYGPLTRQSPYPPPWRFAAGGSVEYVVSPFSYGHRVSV